MVLLTRAINDLSFNIPLVKIEYANGVGKNTVPTYSDEEIDKMLLDKEIQMNKENEATF